MPGCDSFRFLSFNQTMSVVQFQGTLSSALGWISIACWIVVYSPQIYENYRRQSGNGLSVLFAVQLLIGDLCNTFGAALGGLLPTVIIIGSYHTLCDITLLAQIYYYRWKRSKRTSSDSDEGCLEPLLSPRAEKPLKGSTLFLRYIAALLFVITVGVLACWLGPGDAPEDGNATSTLPHGHTATEWGVQFLGWSSAILFLAARIPQIIKNFKTRCKGLSMALFFFAIVGNLTYAMSICAKSMEREYLVRNAAWLAGSILTVFFDLSVIGQNIYYRSVDDHRYSEISEL